MRFLAILSGALLVSAVAQSEDLKIPPVESSFEAGGQRIPVTIWGAVSNPGPDSFRLNFTADLAGLQDNITPVLRSELNRSDRCGERLAVDRGSLTPNGPAASLTVNLRYERWGCAKVFGKEAVKRLVGGDAVVVVSLTPSAAPEGIGMKAEVQKIDADGSLGEVLRSGSAGASVKEKIAASIENAIRKALAMKSALPPRLAAVAAFESVRFSNGPEGRLWLSADAALRLSPDEYRELSRQMR